jgi:PAS domain S-box-containing protein
MLAASAGARCTGRSEGKRMEPANPGERVAAMYRLLCDGMAESFCVVEMLFDAGGRAHDYVILEVNRAFERETGLAGAQGRRISELLPGQADSPWVAAFGAVALGGQPARFEQRSERLGRWYDVHAFRCGAPRERRVGVLFNDITQRKLDQLMAQSVVEYAIILLDPTGHVRTWNAGAQRIKGYAPEEIVGRDFAAFYTPEDVAAGRPAEVLAQAARSGRFDEEGWRVRRDGSRFWASVAVTPLRDGDGKLQGFCKVTRDLSERRRAEEALHAEIAERVRAQEQLRDLNGRLEAEVAARTGDLRGANAELQSAKDRLEDLSARLIRAQEEERGRIARELHDETGQTLTLLCMRLAELGRGRADPAVQACTDLVNEAIAHTRRLAMNLRPAVLDDLGLDAALEWILEQQAGLAGWSASYHGGVGEQRFATQIETACFRIAQEALTNAARYAHATETSVSLIVAGQRLLLQVADDGGGFDVAHFRSPAERTRHFGLVSMQERASLVGAQLEIDSAPGRGTRVRAAFPLQGGAPVR